MAQTENSRAAPHAALRPFALLPASTLIGLVVAIVALVIVAILAIQGMRRDAESGELVTRTMAIIDRLETTVSQIKDAETGQRGYLLTGNERYLDPFTDAQADLPRSIAALRSTLADNPKQSERLERLAGYLDEKLKEMSRTVELRRSGEAQQALELVQTDRGKVYMEQIRAIAADMSQAERGALGQRQGEWRESATLTAQIVVVGTGTVLLLLLIGGAMMSREYRRESFEAWLQQGLATLSTSLQGDQRLELLGASALDVLAGYVQAQVAAIYVTHGDGAFERFAGYALSAAGASAQFRLRESLLGQAASTRRAMTVTDVPDGYLDVNSSLGHARPRSLVMLPLLVHDATEGAIEFGFVRAPGANQLKFLARAADVIGMSIRSAKDRSRLEDLLEETQRQSEELQTQQEELRVSNEELEEQGRALRESRGQLEQQQAELEQTNSQLEEQSQLLETQRDELAQAQDVLLERATDLEQANRYKSEFLANMSHELRTPLNSSLILARLLAENKHGNLSDDQVRYAQTISAAGNDLLTLINDILDLSKIEAGKVEIEPQTLDLRTLCRGVHDVFRPLAEQKGLDLRLTFEPSAPASIESDGQRLGQILKNLLSNALKFTESGTIEMRVTSRDAQHVEISVRDSGIGIAPEQQEVIFEAFRQADGSTHRKYGGTGLGLSISRDLARLLGGALSVDSAAGSGSTFTLRLPLVFVRGEAASAVVDATHTGAKVAMPVPALVAASSGVVTPASIEDDRERLTPGARCLLIVEDDAAFAGVLRDLCHEQNFLCIVVHLAAAGMAAALKYEPQAILLDMQLPDHSGLALLQSLKRDARTRHIPVHIVSVSDLSEQAFRMGAVGYAIKPVNRDQLVLALRKLEARLDSGLRRVLLIEDDERQRTSVKTLLSALDVGIEDVSSAQAALQRLAETTYDCIVMDLNLPDMSGFDLLQKMSEQPDLAFPPVIIYTGRSLTTAEEQRLQRFSRSIIIKDARSPERLLDEVTLFLHQVESRLPLATQRLLSAARSRDSALDGKRVLLVEDDVRNIFALSRVLEEAGLKVEIARNGREAIGALEKHMGSEHGAIDIVLMDIMMPEMDGLTAMREIRKRPAWKRLPIVAITAKAMRDDQERALEAGANDYVAKPIDIEKLMSLVRVWIARR